MSIEENGQQISSISYQQRETKDGIVLFIVNHSQNSGYHALADATEIFDRSKNYWTDSYSFVFFGL